MCSTATYIRKLNDAQSIEEIQTTVDQAISDPGIDTPEISQINYQANVAAHKILLNSSNHLTN